MQMQNKNGEEIIAYVVSKNPIISKMMSSNMVHESAKVKEKMTRMLTLWIYKKNQNENGS